MSCVSYPDMYCRLELNPMFIHYVRYTINRHIHISKHCYSTSVIKPLNVAFFGSDIFSMHILEHLYRVFTNDKSRIKKLEVVTTVSSSNTIMRSAEKLQLTTHVWPNTDSLISKSSSQFDLGILASFGQLLPKKLIESFPL
jgi:predicted RND superfamily exporter protein